MYPDEWIAGRKWDAPRAPLCKGSCREATEGLCGTNFRLWKCIGEKVRGNDFAVESSGFGSTSAKWGQNGHGTFGRWAHREVCHYNPSVSFADSSPYTGEPLPCTASTPHTVGQTVQQIPISRTAGAKPHAILYLVSHILSLLPCPADFFAPALTARRFDCFIFRDVIEFSHGNTRSSCARGGFPAVLKRG